MTGRILVAIDSRELDASLLEIAARLAAERQAELVGLYVEESAFLSAAGLPFSRSFSFRYGWRDLSADEMRRAFQVRAEELRRELDTCCRRWRIAWELRTARGVPAERLLQEADDAELVVIGRARRARHGPLGRTARRAVAECRTPVLLFAQQAEAPDRVVAVFDDDEAVPAAAEEIARVLDLPLHAVVLAADGERGERRRKSAERWMARRGWWTRVKVVDAGDGEAQLTALAGRSPEFLVIGAKGEGGALDLGTLLDAVQGPVLILR